MRAAALAGSALPFTKPSKPWHAHEETGGCKSSRANVLLPASATLAFACVALQSFLCFAQSLTWHAFPQYAGPRQAEQRFADALPHTRHAAGGSVANPYRKSI